MRHIIILIAVTIAAATLGACRETPLIGHLEGQWQIMTVETPGADTVVRPDRSYFCFYRHTANLTRYGGTLLGANLIYRPEADSLSIDVRGTGEWLGRWGIPHVTPYIIDFRIVSLTSKRLVMVYEDSVTFTLRKF